MWVLENQTPFAAERAWVRDGNGAEVWVVAVKGTFIIKRDGSTELAEKQEDVCLVPQYRGEPGRSSLRYESDLIHKKLTTDILLNGHAYAPTGKQATQMDVMMEVGPIRKVLRIYGDREWVKGSMGLSMTPPQPFKRMPIVYERAFGGIDQKSSNPEKHGWEPRNPVGIGFALTPEHLAGQRAPNIEDPREPLRSWEHRPRPAGFGPIANFWSPRLQLAGTYDDTWRKERLPLLPANFAERFYQCAPEDQQAPRYLTGGEPVTLFNLTSDGPLRFTLPEVCISFTTYFFTGEIREHGGVLHTVIAEPDVPRVIMVWHTNLECHSMALKLMKTVIHQEDMPERNIRGS